MNFRQATSALPELWTDHMSNSELMGPTNNYYKSFGSLCAPGTDPHQIAQTLTQYPNVSYVLLVRHHETTAQGAPHDDDGINVAHLHHFFGEVPPGMPVPEDAMFGAVIGMARENLLAAVTAKTLFTRQAGPQLRTPSLQLIIAADTIQAVKDLDLPANDADCENFHPLPGVFVPPFLCETMHARTNSLDDRCQLLLSCIETISERISIVGAENSTTGDAPMETFDDYTAILQYCWCLCKEDQAGLELLPAAELVAPPADSPLQRLGEHIILGHIAPPAVSSEPSAPAISHAARDPTILSIQAGHQALMSKMLELQSGALAGSAPKVKGWTSRIPKYLQQVLLFGSMEDGQERAPTQPNEDFLQFLENAKQQSRSSLEHYLVHQSHLTVNCSIGLAATFYNCAFINSQPAVPENFSVFFLAPRVLAPGDSEQLSETAWNMFVETKQVTPSMISQATTPEISAPVEDVHKAIDQLNNFRGCIAFPLGNTSSPARGLQLLTEEMRQHYNLYLSMAQSNRYFLASILMTAELKFQNFLQSCRDASTPSEVDHRACSFDNEIQAIRSRTFHVQLPGVIAAVVNKQRKADSDGKRKSAPTDSGNDRTKRGRAGDGATATPKNNPEPVNHWILENPHRDIGKLRKKFKCVPKLSGKPVCIQYHCLGRCALGDKCHRSVTHTKLVGDVKTAFNSWFEEAMRGE